MRPAIAQDGGAMVEDQPIAWLGRPLQHQPSVARTMDLYGYVKTKGFYNFGLDGYKMMPKTWQLLRTASVWSSIGHSYTW